MNRQSCKMSERWTLNGFHLQHVFKCFLNHPNMRSNLFTDYMWIAGANYNDNGLLGNLNCISFILLDYYEHFKYVICHWGCLFNKLKELCYNDKCQNDDLRGYINCRLEDFEYYTMARYRRQISCLVEKYINVIETLKKNPVY